MAPVAPAAVVTSTLTVDGRRLVAAFCRAGGDLVTAATQSGFAIKDARAMRESSWWHDAVREHWRENAPSATQGLLVLGSLAQESVDERVRLAAAKAIVDHSVADRAVSAFEGLTGMARNASANRLLARVVERNLLNLPPDQLAVMRAGAERMLEAEASVVTLADFTDRTTSTLDVVATRESDDDESDALCPG